VNSIDKFKDSNGEIDKNGVKQIIPYDEPFLFIDRVLKLDKKNIVAIKEVGDGNTFKGHFKDFPIMPGALIVEGLGQVVGQPIEFVTNLIPSVFIVTLLFNKFRPAEKKEKKLKEDISIAEQVGIKVSHEKKVSEKIRNLIDKEKNPVKALKIIKSKKPVKGVSSKLRDYVDNLIEETNNIIQYIVKKNVNAPQEIINILQQGINQAGQLSQQAQSAEESEDFETAINLAIQAKNIVISAVQQFDSAFQEYQEEQQNRNGLQPGYAR